VIDPRVKGTLTLVTERPVTRQQAFRGIAVGLAAAGLHDGRVQRGRRSSAGAADADAKLQGGSRDHAAGNAPRGDQVVTQVFRLQYESATTWSRCCVR